MAADKDVVILRTFPKLYGMAGLRAGAAFGRPDLLDKIKGFSAEAMPSTMMVGAIASLKAEDLVDRRRKAIAALRAETAERLDRRGFASFPSEANMLMFDVKRPARTSSTPCSPKGSSSDESGPRCRPTSACRSGRASRWPGSATPSAA